MLTVDQAPIIFEVASTSKEFADGMLVVCSYSAELDEACSANTISPRVAASGKFGVGLQGKEGCFDVCHYDQVLIGC
jgi:hypothetical protein